MVLSTLDRLEVLCRGGSGQGGWRLPHRLAVCVAKLDEPEVLAAARRAGLLTTVAGPTGHPVPAVRPADAERFFDHLCDNALDGGGALIRHAIKRYFRPERVRYFTTSSIGFYHDGRPDDLYNMTTGGPGPLLRGNIRPVNVLEPLLWLQLAD